MVANGEVDREQNVRASAAPAGNGSSFQVEAPQISLPKGGGALRAIAEKFGLNPATGTGSLTVPIYASPGRSGFHPQLALHYDSGLGTGPFGFGWSLAINNIARKTDKGLPRYLDDEESDSFILSGSDDLVPLQVFVGGEWKRHFETRTVYGKRYAVRRYRPRLEGSFVRIERWTNLADPADSFWRTIDGNNITSWYGRTAESRIADPADPTRIFAWHVCESHDSSGNAIVYRYKAEDSTGVDLAAPQERNRTDLSRSAKCYLKRVLYGNGEPYLPDLAAAVAAPLPGDWRFQIVFDYGEHDLATPLPGDTGPWACRSDPYTNCRSGFEVRGYRLCRRVLMFHDFDTEAGVGKDCLVRATTFTYALPSADARKPAYSYLSAIAQISYRRNPGGGYFAASLPPLEFEYSSAEIDETVREVDAASLENLPAGLNGPGCHWVDLDGEGLPGILSEAGAAWFYKPNLSPTNRRDLGGDNVTLALFGPIGEAMSRPAQGRLGPGSATRLMDLSGDGMLDVVDFDPGLSGFFERRFDAAWESFRPFNSMPTLDWNDPNLRFIDLTGDGLADILVTEDQAFCWHRSLGGDGFAERRSIAPALDEELGPRLVFADRSDTIFVADMSGDGLADLVRVRNGEVSYWPNLGYGRFGPKITMDGSPRFDRDEGYDPNRVEFADIDGSGTADIIYFGRAGVDLYFNLGGNGFAPVRRIEQFPHVENVSAAAATDLLGIGTACLVWSSPLLGDAGRSLRYIDLMAGGKPHLLTAVRNNMGAETVIHYAPSTQFYLADKLAGTPWVTRLPFPLHVVDRIETYDYVSRNLFVSSYVYHHGHYDGLEREFRGFGRVDQLDSERYATLSAVAAFPAPTNVDAASHVPPVLTKTWFHTGAYFGGEQISSYFAQEYYGEGDPGGGVPGLSEMQRRAMLLADTILPDTILLADGSRQPVDLNADEMREAARALRGVMLRQEVYALDGSEAEDRPYRASEQNFTLEMLQPRGENPHAVFYSHTRESISFDYDRKLYRVLGGAIMAPDAPAPARSLADPRVSHAFTLAVDPWGNVLRQATVSYGRRYRDPDLSPEDQEIQAQLLAGCSLATYTNAVDLPDDWRRPQPAEASSWQLLQLPRPAADPDITNLIGFEEIEALLADACDGAHDLPYEAIAPADLNPGQPYRRLLGLTRQYYRPDDLGASAGDVRHLLPLGQVERLGQTGEAYRLATSDTIIARACRRNGTPLLAAPAAVLASTADDGGGYVDLDHDGHYWVPSGRSFYMAEAPEPVAELAAARAGFFLPRRFEDAFGQATTVEYDGWQLFITARQDALGNSVRAVHDYRVLAPAMVTDPNDNRSTVAFDTLGLAVAGAVMGKSTEQLGDTLSGFPLDLSTAEIDAFHDAADPATLAPGLLGLASTRTVYDVGRFYRSRLAAPSDPDQWLPAGAAQITREIHASDLPPGTTSPLHLSFAYSDGFGRVIQEKAQTDAGPVTDGGPSIDLRWIGSGWTVFNNKGDTVRAYEPFFSQLDKGHQFEFATIVGVSSILCRDPLGRVVARIHPNHSYDKVVLDPWRMTSWDVNDTVLVSDPADDPDVGDYFSRLPPGDYLPSWRAQRDGGALGAEEQDAAAKSAAHAGTPSVSHFDTLGRPYVTVADNGALGKYASHSLLDFGGETLAVTDALGRIIASFDYDMAGTRVREGGIDSGERWQVKDVAGNTIRHWDSRGHNLRATFDALRRPVAKYVLGTDATASDPRTIAGELLFEKVEYGEGRPNDRQLNLRGRIYRRFDTAGIVFNLFTDPDSGVDAAFDFKGNSLGTCRQFLANHKALPDWSQPPPALLAEQFTNSMLYDALNRVIVARAPDGTVARPTFGKAGLLRSFEVNIRGAAAPTPFVGNVDYNAKAQRLEIAYGSAANPVAVTRYKYDPQTFRLARLTTGRPGFPAAQRAVQELSYSYDPGGRITHIADAAQQTIFFNNAIVEPETDYTYDAIYRLIKASGREHLGIASGNRLPPSPSSYNDSSRIGLHHPADGNAMGTWRETYSYDAAGNLTEMVHQGANPASPGWTRSYAYNEASLLEPGKMGNRLSATSVGGSSVWDEPYGWDAHGNAAAMPQLQELQWDFLDQLAMTRRQAVNADDVDGTAHNAERTWYVCNAAGQRVRKVTEAASGKKTKERIYLGTLEIYREFSAAGAITLERQTLHVTDDRERIALIETEIGQASAVRFQFGNHLGSALIELDDAGGIITYEEYYPYGSTSYQAGRSAETSLKRYRYNGKERDEETGLYYMGARYYASWIGRWISADPIGVDDGPNLYAYCRGNPISYSDPSGTETEQTTGVGITINSNGVSVGPISVTGPSSNGPPLAPLPGMPGAQAGNSPEDLSHFIWITARFKQGMPNGRTPQKVGQDAHADATATLNDLKSAPANQKLKDVDRIYSEVRVENGTVTQIGGKPGGPKGSLNPDVVAVKPGETLNVGDTNLPAKTEMTADNKAGAGQIAQKYGAVGGRQVTINGQTNSADTDPSLLQPTQRTGVGPTSPRDADIDHATGQVANSPNTTAAAARQNKTVPGPPVEEGTTSGNANGGGGKASSNAGDNTSGGSKGGTRTPVTGGSPASGALGAVGKTIVPGVAEAEVGLMGLAGLAAQSQVTAGLVAPLMTAAEAVPVAAGVGVVGAGAGLGARALAKELGASDAEANVIGLEAAVLTGAALGSFIPGVGTVAGAVIGGLVAGAFYLFSIW